MKILIFGFILTSISVSVFAQNSFFSDSSFAIKTHFLTNSGQHLEKIYFEDLNNDSIPDAIFLDRTSGVNIHQQSVNIKMIPGSSTGFDSSSIQTILTDKWIEELFFADWNNDGFKDLILEKSYPIDENSANSGLINILLLNGIEIQDTLAFFVPNQVYQGNEGPAVRLTELIDMNLDGNIDMVLHGFSPVTIGWNNDGEIPEFEEITNYGFNTYTARIIDINQDGYPDFINDDQYWKQPVIHINNKNKTFTRKAVGLAGWSFNNPEDMYWSFHPHWLNDDYYPDMLVRKAGPETDGSEYELYIYQASSDKYKKLDSELDNHKHGNMYSIHLNNDGFTDFLDIRYDGITLWVNNQLNDFTPYPISFSSEFFSINNLIYSDIDNDNDLDIFFTLTDGDILYQIENLENFENLSPTKPEIKTAFFADSKLVVSWNQSYDHESQNGHLKYELEISSSKNVINVISHSDSLDLTSFDNDEYSIRVTAIDPIGKKSKASDIITLTATNTKQENPRPNKITLHQNYPNPFNPSTTISFELNNPAEVTLTVFDALGRTIATLVNERKSTGLHTVNFDASNLSSGIYFYRLETSNFVETKRLTLIK